MTLRNALFELGAAYYPDYIPGQSLTQNSDGTRQLLNKQERLESDFVRMQKQGIHTIRVGEFCWSTVEPEPGKFNFDIFHRTLDLALKFNIKVIFCTPTATPPKWLIDLHPDILPVTRSGNRIPFGSRRHYDFCHPVFRNESRRITEKFAKEFGTHKALVSWQTDNEFGCHASVFQFSNYYKKEFQNWLKKEYNNDLLKLNEAWFTCFWSQGYTNFEQIEVPFASWSDQNPSLELDFRRFCNEMVVLFQKEQCDLIRAHSPNRPITHNFMALFTDLDPWSMSVDLDEAGFDHYQMESEPHPVTSHWQFALMRSLKQKKFLILEQQPLQVNWQPTNRRFSFDWLFLWGLQSAFLGARGMYYFCWQRMYGGAEQFHDAFVTHDVRVPQTHQERLVIAKNSYFSKLEQEFQLKSIPDVCTDALCIHDFESLWTHEITAQSQLYSTRKQIDCVASLCHGVGLGLHFARTIEDAKNFLSKFKVLILPGYAFEFTQSEQKIMTDFANSGGKILSFPRTAMKKRNNQMSPLPLNLFNEDDFYFDDSGALLAHETEPFQCVGKKTTQDFTGHLWAEKIKIVNQKNWQPMAIFSDGLYQNWPAVIQNTQFINGGSYTHFATIPENNLNLHSWILELLNLKSAQTNSQKEGIQIYPLQAGDKKYIAAVNFTDSDAEIKLIQNSTFNKWCVASIDSKEQLIFISNTSAKQKGAEAKIILPARHTLFSEIN